jgi:DNA-binding transcriptional LysR family regulator
VVRGILDSAADVGVVAGPIATTGLETQCFSTDRLVLVVPRAHRLARRKSIAFADTLDEDHVGMHPGSTLQDFLAKVTARLGKPLRLRVELASFDAVCRMIGAGVGIGVVPESCARRNLAAMQLAQLELTDDWRVRERYVLVREGEALPAYAQALIDALCAFHAADEPPATSPRPSGSRPARRPARVPPPRGSG